MFHHFHDDGIHRRGQGSIAREHFHALLASLAANYNLLSADDYHRRALAGALSDSDICLSFDDALLCQYDVAVPVLDAFDVKAFFFVYTSIFTERPDPLELYRDFRNTRFADVEAFYAAFFALFEQEAGVLYERYRQGYPDDYLAAFAFYTENDRRFRYARDQVLGTAVYDDLMQALMARHGYETERRRRELWMTEQQVAALAGAGHVIGLHSHSHPMQMHRLDRDAQHAEYTRNHRMLTDICGIPPRTMSHPCGNYNSDTLAILGGLGITLGFRSNLHRPDGAGLLEVPREDHANLMQAMA